MNVLKAVTAVIWAAFVVFLFLDFCSAIYPRSPEPFVIFCMGTCVALIAGIICLIALGVVPAIMKRKGGET